MKAIDAVTMECCGQEVEPRAAAVNYGTEIELQAVWYCARCHSMHAADPGVLVKTADAIDYENKQGPRRVILEALRDSQRQDTEGR